MESGMSTDDIRVYKTVLKPLNALLQRNLGLVFSVSFFQMVLFSVIGNYCYDKFSSFVPFLRLFL